MKILLFGKYGQLGWELHQTLQGLGEVVAFDYPEVDFTRPDSLPRLIEDSRPAVVINAAAYTDVDKAESEREKARLINAEAPGVLAEACRSVGAVFIHYSTDYVFDGKKGSPYVEADPPNPLNAYGRTKLEGDHAVLQGGGVNFILRTAWVYSLRRESFVTKVLRWAHSQNELRIVSDQISNPTWARSLAEMTGQLLSKAGKLGGSWLGDRRGLYHLAGRGFASRYDFAVSILRHCKEPLIGRKIIPALSSDFHNKAVRPPFSALECGRFEKTFGLSLPEWGDALKLALLE